MINAALQSALQDLKPVSKATVEIVVELQNGCLMDSLAKDLYAEFQRMAPYASYSPVAQLEEKELLAYLSTLLWMRVAEANGLRDKTFNDYKSLRRTVAVHVLFYQLLICVGKAYDKDFNIQLIPAYKIPQELLLSPDDMLRISNLFRQFEDSGMKICFGIPLGEEGELDFMAMSHVTNEVVSFKKSHSVFGFLKAFTAERELNAITGGLSTIVYGYDTDYKAKLSVAIRAINHADL